MLKVRTLFSGIGSPESALKNLQIPYELIDFCEVDKYAVKSYCAVHGVSKDKNLGDITKVWGRNLPYADLLVWGFPCTDISVAGKQSGIIEGQTRSGLYYEGLRILRETKPKYSVIENVKNLTGKKFKVEFEQMLKDIEVLGYNNYWKVLNAKDYGIPQNRERVFIVSIRQDIDTGTFDFPIGFDNGLRLKDLLEDEVDEKYYIAKEKCEKLIQQFKETGRKTLNIHPSGKGMNGIVRNDEFAATVTTNKGEGQKIVLPCITPDRVEKRQNGRRFKEDGEPMFTITSQDRHGILESKRLGGIFDSETQKHQAGSVWDKEGLCPTLDTMQGGYRQPSVIVKSPMPELVGGIGDINFGKQYRQGNRVYSSEKTAMCLMAQPVGNTGGNSYLYQIDYRIRKLTPKECWRLMGFTDEEFERAEKVNSNSQLYKQAGNSIVTNVLAAIFKNLLQSEITQIYEENKELS